MNSLSPPFTRESALIKVRNAQNLWNTLDAEKVSMVYTEDSIWRNRSEFFVGREKIKEFLTRKWKNEVNYKLKKRLFAFESNKIAVQFWYEWYDNGEEKTWKRTYGIEHWTFADNGLMAKRIMSANDRLLKEEERWFTEGINIDEFEVPELDG